MQGTGTVGLAVCCVLCVVCCELYGVWYCMLIQVLLSFFLSYPGWYNGPASGINKIWTDRATWCAAAFPSKPFIISETGAGGIVGEHSKNQSRWSLE